MDHKMEKLSLAIIGSGATALYSLKHILDHSDVLKHQFTHISIFEKGAKMGYGMPYNPVTTDKYNLSNISSEEIPMLFQTFADWLRNQNKEDLKKWHITSLPIQDSEVYSRIALGEYFHAQFHVLIDKLRKIGFQVDTFVNQEIIDIRVKNKTTIELIGNKTKFNVSKVVIATGHHLQTKDKPESGYYETPWPIHKIIPKKNQYYNFEIGILGASLSAFDVVTSLAHRHGKFTKTNNGLKFQLHKNSENFRMTLHAAEGWLPHLQYEQVEPFREIYRHATREKILSLRNDSGYLRIDTFFNNICKPALQKAFKKDKNNKMAKMLSESHLDFKEFINIMAENHEYINSFQGMKKEMIPAKDSVENNNPIHWMETLDDLMYCLNFHAEMMPAEDHLFFKKEIKPFLMNVIAALPLSSAKILLALYDAEVVDLIPGKVEILQDSNSKEMTKIKISTADETKLKSYNLFINCSGSDQVEIENYLFKSLVTSGMVRKAQSKFATVKNISQIDTSVNLSTVFSNNNELFLNIGGIDIDSAYHIIGTNGETTSRIQDLSFPHTFGCRPYSYGLQACYATSAIVVDSWLTLEPNTNQVKTINEISNIYVKDEDL
ncbi:FAD/NAD(P)-binding protein [Bizionia arctica]|uniref:FAD/NAD(P) binding domain-containing protein n=1 Tax=Bizionia arctica TaxID=1495645 RepID=A0A917LTC0_9FLAO|nr:FAD/NAD(P)-binding protein [Bizionia arctica]GGG56659.1 FAD/NAD(P) binding domain-containing protein [Bizionia arctica]